MRLIRAVIVGILSLAGVMAWKSVWATGPNPPSLFMPLIMQPFSSTQINWSGNLPIWSQTMPDGDHQVVLFRRRFSMDGPVQEATLAIFADTRYEAWLDGRWLGRGPARFSKVRQEYDVLPAGDLQPGEHTLAVLVQWAPNIRRSESATPRLIGHLQGETDRGAQVVVRTGSEWHAQVTDAWRIDAEQVHAWRLLGPTELLDLRRLPVDWTSSGYDDSDWPLAVMTTVDGSACCAPRSIPLLVNMPFASSVIDAGLLSPGTVLAQVEAGGAYSLPLVAVTSTLVTVETLVDAATGATLTVQLDGIPLAWQAAVNLRPDVIQAAQWLNPGPHLVQFAEVPPAGLVFTVSQENLQPFAAPFSQGRNAGRRLLLAQAVRQLERVQVAAAGDALNLTFTGGPAYAVLDIGRVVHGRMRAEVSGPSGTVLDIGWDERLLPETLRPLPSPGTQHPEWNQVDSWILDGRTRPITTIDARAGRYLLIAVWSKEPVTLRNLLVEEERYPVEQKGWFHSSNPMLDTIWQLGVDTAYPSMQDAYADPWRERGQWWGDAYVADHINQVAFGDTRLLRRGLLAIADGAFPDGRLPAYAPNNDGARMLDYAMLWVQSLHDYLALTGDTEFGREVYGTLIGFMDYLAGLRNAETGLLDVPAGNWAETALVDWAGNNSRTGQSAVLNALYTGTLQDAAHIARLLGDNERADQWQSTAAALPPAMNEVLFLEDQGRYMSSLVDGQVVAPTTHAQVWPLAFEVVPPERVNTVARAALEPFWVEIFGMNWALEGLGRAGYIDEAVDLIERFYGELVARGATTLWEHWDSYKHYKAALSHVWGGGATWFLTTRVLGVRRVGPDNWVVKPAFRGVVEAAGAVPLEHGTIDASWHAQACARTLTVTAPPGSQGEIVLATDGVTAIYLNGVVIWSSSTPEVWNILYEEGLLTIPSTGGQSVVDIALPCQ